MSPRSIALSVVSLGLTAALAAQEANPAPRPVPAKGSSVWLTRERRQEFREEAGDHRSVTTTVHTLHVEVTGLDDQGRVLVDVKVARVHGSLDLGAMGEVAFDSRTLRADDGAAAEAGLGMSPSQMSRQMMTLAGKSIAASVGPSGEITLRNAAALVEPKGEHIGFPVTEELLRDLVGCAFAPLPKDPMTPNTTWERLDTSSDGLVPLAKSWRFTLSKADATSLTITGTGSVAKGPLGAPDQDLGGPEELAQALRAARESAQVTDGTLVSEHVVSRQDGLVLAADSKVSMRLQMESPMGESVTRRTETIATKRIDPATAAPDQGSAGAPPSPTRDTLGCYMMLTFPRVRAELGIGEEQARQLDRVLERMEGAEAGPALDLLTTAQRERFQQLAARCFGILVCCDPAWAKKLGVPADRQARLHDMVTKALSGLRIGSAAGCATLPAVREAARSVHDAITDMKQADRELLAHLGEPIDNSIFNGPSPATDDSGKVPGERAAEGRATSRLTKNLLPIDQTAEQLRDGMAQHGTAWIDADSVVFVYRGDAERVQLAGFWQYLLQTELQRVAGTQDLWALRVRVERASELVLGYSFQVVRNGAEIAEAERVLRGPKAPAPMPRSAALTGTITTHTIASKILTRQPERTVRVYLPPGTKPGHRPLALFTTDGAIEEYAHHIEPMVAQGLLPPIAIVAVATNSAHPEGSREYYDDRNQEYVPWQSYMRGEDQGHFDRHLRWVADEVVPWAEATFGIGGSRERRIVQGYSNGADFAANAVVRRADVFGLAIVNSMGNGVDAPAPRLPIRVYCQAGTLEPGFLSATKAFVAQLQTWQMPHRFTERVGAHDMAIWAEEVAPGLAWLQQTTRKGGRPGTR